MLKLYLCSRKRKINKQTNKQIAIRYEILPIFKTIFIPVILTTVLQNVSCWRFLKEIIAKYVSKEGRVCWIVKCYSYKDNTTKFNNMSLNKFLKIFVIYWSCLTRFVRTPNNWTSSTTANIKKSNSLLNWATRVTRRDFKHIVYLTKGA